MAILTQEDVKAMLRGHLGGKEPSEAQVAKAIAACHTRGWESADPHLQAAIKEAASGGGGEDDGDGEGAGYFKGQKKSKR